MTKATLIRKIKDCTIYSTGEGTNSWLLSDEQAEKIIKLISKEIKKNRPKEKTERSYAKELNHNLDGNITVEEYKAVHDIVNGFNLALSEYNSIVDEILK